MLNSKRKGEEDIQTSIDTMDIISGTLTNYIMTLTLTNCNKNKDGLVKLFTWEGCRFGVKGSYGAKVFLNGEGGSTRGESTFTLEHI